MRPALRALIGVIVLVLVGDAAALATIDKEPAFPKKWDSRVAKLASFVEDNRHLRYKHAVDVRFLTEAEYKKEADISGDITDEDNEEIKNFVGQARALGLLSKDTDLLKDLNTIQTGGTLAYYDSDAEEMVIRGTKLTPGLRVTVVHELTHALQDQYFDLGTPLKPNQSDEFFSGLAEGDATRVENLFVEAMSESEQNEYFDEQNQQSDDAGTALDGVAPSLLQLFGAPYALGRAHDNPDRIRRRRGSSRRTLRKSSVHG